jgi:hypothetical protein
VHKTKAEAEPAEAAEHDAAGLAVGVHTPE